MTLQNCSGHNIIQRLAIGESYQNSVTLRGGREGGKKLMSQ